MSYVSLQGVSKHFGATTAVKSLDLGVERGEFFSLLGPSGCGKTTTLRMIAGFIRPSSGSIVINGRDVTALPPEARGIGIVFQNYAIFPHLSVFENIAFGLRMRKAGPEEITAKVEAALEQVGLQGYGHRFERELSGGQKQRVALARVLVIEPEVLLLDEPLSALDKKMREEMKVWIKNIQKKVGITTIYVTHDQGEALTMSSRIGIMNEGEILQIGSPEAIYDRPVNRFIGTFIGESNILKGRVVGLANGRCRLELESVEVEASTGEAAPVVGQSAELLIRPEKIRLRSIGDSSAVMLRGKVVSEAYHGASVRFEIEAAGHELHVDVPNRPEARAFDVGDDVVLDWDADMAVIVGD